MELDTRVVEKFWKNVEKTNTCWNWNGSVNEWGAPRFRLSQVREGKKIRQVYSARRISLILAGRELSSSKETLSSCKNKLCVNPDHIVGNDEERFNSKIQKLSEDQGGCWVYIGALNTAMYGQFSIWENGINIQKRAHVHSWELFSGRLVPKGIEVCHTCDHPWCVNPSHLFLGTRTDNVRDMMTKGRGRQPKGDRNAQSKLTTEQVIQIKKDISVGVDSKTLAMNYSVSIDTIYNIRKGKTWTHLK